MILTPFNNNQSLLKDLCFSSPMSGGVNSICVNQFCVKMRTQELEIIGMATFCISRNPLPPEINHQVIQPCIRTQSSIIHESDFGCKTTHCKIISGYPITTLKLYAKILSGVVHFIYFKLKWACRNRCTCHRFGHQCCCQHQQRD